MKKTSLILSLLLLFAGGVWGEEHSELNDLSGTWVGGYNLPGLGIYPEIIKITKGNKNYYQGTKITGDEFIPAGEVSFIFNLVKERCRIQTAKKGFKDNSFQDCNIVKVTKNFINLAGIDLVRLNDAHELTKSGYAEKIAESIFFKTLYDFENILIRYVENYFMIQLNMPSSTINKVFFQSIDQTSLNKLYEALLNDLLEKMELEYNFLGLKALEFRKQLIKEFSKEELSDLYQKLPSNFRILNTRNFWVLRPFFTNKKALELTQQYRFSNKFYKELQANLSLELYEPLLESMDKIMQNHGYGEDFLFETDSVLMSKEISGEWKISGIEGPGKDHESWNEGNIYFNNNIFKIKHKGNVIVEFDDKFKGCKTVLNNTLYSCNVLLTTKSRIDIELPSAFIFLRRNGYSGMELCNKETNKRCVGVTNWHNISPMRGYLGDFKRVSKNKRGQKVQMWGKNFVYDGFGTASYKDGSKYVGEWKDHRRHGYGNFFYTRTGHYKGQFDNGHPHGEGIWYRKDGSVYEGSFENGDLHGKGKLTMKDGNIYEGKWIESKKEGQHKLTQNGAFFECNFSEGKQTKICSPIQN